MAITTKQEYINGCYTRYGTRPLTAMEIKTETRLYNGMYAVLGIVPEDGISIDLFYDANKGKVKREIAVHIGNAVPVKLGHAIGISIKRHLEDD